MKVCSRCGEEIATKDGENTCDKCDKNPVRRVKRERRIRERALKDLGLTKVKGALGGTYWE